MKNRTHILLALGLLMALAVLGAIMRAQIPPRLDLPLDLQSTALASEFVSSPDEIASIVGSDHRYAKPLEQQQYIDFAFILCYVALFVLFALTLSRYDVPGARVLAWTALVCAVAAGAFDFAENFAILKYLHTPSASSTGVRSFSVPKWALAFFVLAIESVVFFFWPTKGLWWRAAAIGVGALALFAGGSGVLFSLLVSVPDIAWSAEWMTWAMAAMLAFLAAILIRSSLPHRR